MDGVREKVLEKLSEALVACGENILHREYVTNLKAMMASEGSTKQGFLMFLSLALSQMPTDCEACAALLSIKTLLESEEEVTVADDTEHSQTATDCFHDTLVGDQIETSTGTDSHSETATGTESHPETSTGTETVEDVKDPKLPQSLSQVEVEELLRAFDVLTEENGWTSVSYGADLCYQGKVQHIFNVRYGALDTPVIGFKDDSTGEYRVFVAFEHIKKETVAECKVQPFKFTYGDREPWWGCELKRHGNSLTAEQTIETFQSITMPSMGIRTLARKKEVKAKRGEMIICPSSCDMDTIDRLCELTPNEKKRYKRHVKYLFLVELETKGRNLQEIQSAPRVKTTWGEEESMPLWSPVIEHWDPNKKNLEKTSPQLMHDINDKYQSYCLSFADFMRATLLPGYWLALKTSSPGEEPGCKAATWVDKPPSPQDLLDRCKEKVRLDNMPLIGLYQHANCLPVDDVKEILRRRNEFDRILHDDVLQHINVPTSRGALCDPSWVRGTHGAKELCSKTEERCQDCTALYQQLSGVLRRFESDAPKDRSTRSRSTLGDEEQKELAQRLKSSDFKTHGRGQDRISTRSGGIDSVVLFLSWLMRYLYNLDALPFELDIVILCASAYFSKLVDLYIVHSSLNPGRTISGYVCDDTLKKKRDRMVWLLQAVSSKTSKLVKPLEDRPEELKGAGLSRSDIIALRTRFVTNEDEARRLNYKYNGDTVKQIVGGHPVNTGLSPSLSYLRQAAKYLRSSLTVALFMKSPASKRSMKSYWNILVTQLSAANRLFVMRLTGRRIARILPRLTTTLDRIRSTSFLMVAPCRLSLLTFRTRHFLHI